MVSFEASVPILMAPVVPEFRVKDVAEAVVIVPAPVKSRESMSMIVPSIESWPRLPSSFMVTDPVEPETSNSVKSIAAVVPMILLSPILKALV